MLPTTLLTSRKPAFPPSLLVNEALIRMRLSNRCLGAGGSFSSSSVHHPEAVPPRRLPTVQWAKEVKVEPALSATGLSGASLTQLTLSSSGELLLSSSTASIIS